MGFAEALAAPETVWSLVDDGFHVIAFARRGRASALRNSRHVVCHEICTPEQDLQTALSELRSLMSSVGCTADGVPRVLLPLDDKAVWLCSRVQLDNGWLLAGPRGANAELALNKCLQTQLAQDAGFAVPTTLFARTAKEVFAFGNEESFPIILRPAECIPILQGRLQKCRKYICANPIELERAVNEWGERVPLLAQKFIIGAGGGAFGLTTPDGVRAWSAHRRLRMMNPQGSGSSACISQPVSDELKAKAEALIMKAGWQGVFMIELLHDDSGKTWFVELNGRSWGSMALSRRQGLEYAAWNVRLAIDPESSVGMNVDSTPAIVCRNAGREFMHLLFVARGPKSKALSTWPSFWKTTTEVGRVRKGETWYNWRSDDPKVFFADFWYTIKDNVFKSKPQ